MHRLLQVCELRKPKTVTALQAGLVDPWACVVGLQQGAQVPSRESSDRGSRPGSERGGKVEMTDDSREDARHRAVPGVADQERDACRPLVEGPLPEEAVLPEQFPVVRGVDDDRVLVETKSLETLEETPHAPVRPREGGQVGAHDVVRLFVPKSRDPLPLASPTKVPGEITRLGTIAAVHDDGSLAEPLEEFLRGEQRRVGSEVAGDREERSPLGDPREELERRARDRLLHVEDGSPSGILVARVVGLQEGNRSGRVPHDAARTSEHGVRIRSAAVLQEVLLGLDPPEALDVAVGLPEEARDVPTRSDVVEQGALPFHRCMAIAEGPVDGGWLSRDEGLASGGAQGDRGVARLEPRRLRRQAVETRSPSEGVSGESSVVESVLVDEHDEDASPLVLDRTLVVIGLIRGPGAAAGGLQARDSEEARGGARPQGLPAGRCAAPGVVGRRAWLQWLHHPMMPFMRGAILVVTLLILGSCSDQPSPPDPLAGGTGAQAEGGAARGAPTGPIEGDSAGGGARVSGFAPGGPVSDEALADHHVVLEIEIGGTSVGSMAFELWSEAAPVTVRNFLRLVDEGFYDGLTFHRVLREFMVQGGCPRGDGTGNSPYGTIPAEVSTAPERDHRYGVLSMARMGGDPDSASCQFFICCDDGPALWNLDGDYTTFGRLSSGVAALEAMATVPVSARRGEPSRPTVEIRISKARVIRGNAPRGEAPLQRPGKEIAEEPRVVVHSLLVACGAVPGRSPRTPEAANLLATELLAQAEHDGLLALVAEHSDEPGARTDERYAIWRLLADGVRDREGDLAIRAMSRDLQGRLQEAAGRLQAGELTRDDYVDLSRQLQREQSEFLLENRWRSVSELPPAVGEAAFTLGVGERVIVPWDPALAPRGYTLLERVE